MIIHLPQFSPSCSGSEICINQTSPKHRRVRITHEDHRSLQWAAGVLENLSNISLQSSGLQHMSFCPCSMRLMYSFSFRGGKSSVPAFKGSKTLRTVEGTSRNHLFSDISANLSETPLHNHLLHDTQYFVLVQSFTCDVHKNVLRIDDTLNNIQPLKNPLVTCVHLQNAAHVQLDVVPRLEHVVRCLPENPPVSLSRVDPS